MKISKNWLFDYIKTGLSTEELCEILTDIGLEVEGTESVYSRGNGLDKIVVGHVLTCEKHPEADRLSLTSVDVNAGEPLQIVCGAPNVAAGQKVLIALEGAQVIGKDGSTFLIKKGKIRGASSEGMICAEDELGLGSSHDGILVLANDAPVGAPAQSYLNITEDTLIEIGLTPNRSDATNHRGVARDLYAALKFRGLGDTSINFKLAEPLDAKELKSDFQVNVEKTDACKRYSGVILNNIHVTESPSWLKEKLNTIGIRSINNVVDITNYILHDMGQPLHAFDLDKISGNGIIVRTLSDQPDFITLDGVVRKLHHDDLMICDGKGNPLCIAGVFGGEGSGVSETTTNIFLESAYFSASSIRKTGARHKLHTDAGRIFEKGADINATLPALHQAISLLIQEAGAKLGSAIFDIYPMAQIPSVIALEFEHLNQVAGSKIHSNDVKRIVEAMDMLIDDMDDKQIIVQIPSNKTDVVRPIDLIEEILRIYGINRLPEAEKLSYAYVNDVLGKQFALKETISNQLVAQGFYEAMSVSITESKHFEKTIPVPKENLIFINNTGNMQMDVMRPNLLVSALENVLTNFNRRQIDLKLFEWGKSYLRQEEKIVETEYLSLALSGQRYADNWIAGKGIKSGFYDMKSYIDRLLDRCGLNSRQESELDDAFLADAIEWRRGQVQIAKAGKIKSKILAAFDIKMDVWYGEINWVNLFHAINNNKVHTTELNKFQSLTRDLALIVDESVKYTDIAKIVQKTLKPFVQDIRLFDVFTDVSRLGEGKKSYAISIIMEQDSGSFKDDEIDQLMTKLVNECEKQLGAQVRK